MRDALNALRGARLIQITRADDGRLQYEIDREVFQNLKRVASK